MDAKKDKSDMMIMMVREIINSITIYSLAIQLLVPGSSPVKLHIDAPPSGLHVDAPPSGLHVDASPSGLHGASTPDPVGLPLLELRPSRTCH